MANITVREHITISCWVDGSGWSYTQDHSDKIVEIDAAAVAPDAPMDWSWWEVSEETEGQDTQITVSYYSISDDPDDAELLSQHSIWESELREARQAVRLDDDDLFQRLWRAALASEDAGQYIWEQTSASSDLRDRTGHLHQIWDVAHMSIADIRRAAGLTQAAMATRFCIPKRTIENWCTGDRTPPDYVRLMMAETLGLIRRLSKTTGGMNMEKRYVVVDRPISDGDWFQTVYRTAEEANEAAKTQWWYLTKAEKKRRHIAAYVVTESDLDPADVEEYGLNSDYPWMGAPNMNDFPGAFDSAALAEDSDDD